MYHIVAREDISDSRRLGEFRDENGNLSFAALA
jgi:hypothetical protein